MVPHISVCICTFKRPRYLARLLKELRSQVTSGEFTYSVVIADNDAQGSARPLAIEFGRLGDLEVTYCVEPRQNISLTRNRAIEQAKGEYLVFIDDDEFPTPTWLRTFTRPANNTEPTERSVQSSPGSKRSRLSGWFAEDYMNGQPTRPGW